jgi:hypothetical protein
MCGAMAMGFMADSGVPISYDAILMIAVIGWMIIVLYSGWRAIKEAIRLRIAREEEEPAGRERYFDVLNTAHDIKDRLKLLEKDAGRNIDRIYSLGKEAGYHDRAD